MGLAFAGIFVSGIALALASLAALRGFGAQPGIARRLAGPRQLRIGDLFTTDPLPERPVRVIGRIRCQEPLQTATGERLVAFHRDVEVRAGGRWRSLERMRESRSFELWDHDGSVVLDPARAAEPLITIPLVWRGSPSELEEPHTSAAARVTSRNGPTTEARAVTRTINVTDRLLVLAYARRDESGRPQLEPPPGGYLISTLELPDAMRVLGGQHGRLAAAGVVGMAIGISLVVVGGIGALASAFLG